MYWILVDLETDDILAYSLSYWNLKEYANLKKIKGAIIKEDEYGCVY